VAFNTALQATSISTAASGSVHSSGGGVHSSGGSIVVGTYTANTVNFTDATSIVIGDVPVISVTAPDALSIELHYDGSTTVSLASLSVTAGKATSVVSKAIGITGAATFDVAATGAITMLNLTKAGSFDSDAATVTADVLATVPVYETDAVSVSLPALTTVATSFTASKATSLSADMLKTVGTLSLAKIGSISLPAATAITSISAPLATSVTASLAVVGTVDIDETGTAVSATDLTVVGSTSLDLGSVTTITDAATLTSLTLNSQVATYDVTGLVLATSITYKGKTAAVDFTSSSANAKLASLTLGGKLGDVTVITSATATATALTTIVTSGTMESLNVTDNADLTTLTLGHAEDATVGTSFTLDNNDALTTFTTSFDRVTSFVVTGNAKLASFDASSMTQAPNNAASTDAYTFTVTGNYFIGATAALTTGLSGTYTALTATTDEAFAQSSLATLKPYLLLGYGTGKKFTATTNLDYVVTASNVTAGANKALAAVAGANIVTADEIGAIE
jgi:hypothetical protein